MVFIVVKEIKNKVNIRCCQIQRRVSLQFESYLRMVCRWLISNFDSKTLINRSFDVDLQLSSSITACLLQSNLIYDITTSLPSSCHNLQVEPQDQCWRKEPDITLKQLQYRLSLLQAQNCTQPINPRPSLLTKLFLVVGKQQLNHPPQMNNWHLTCPNNKQREYKSIFLVLRTYSSIMGHFFDKRRCVGAILLNYTLKDLTPKLLSRRVSFLEGDVTAPMPQKVYLPPKFAIKPNKTCIYSLQVEKGVFSYQEARLGQSKTSVVEIVERSAVFIGVEKEVPYNIYSIAKFDFMDSQSCSTQEEAPIVYGFLCEQTNVFYAFENKEQYQEFMDWLAAQQQQSLQQEGMMTDDELVRYSDRATDSIMQVFQDPIFAGALPSLEMEEIDF